MATADSLGERGDGVADRERRGDCALRRILVRDRRSEESHESVAVELVDDAFDAIDLLERELEVLVEEVVVLLRIEPLGDRRRADEVAKEHGHELALAGDAAARV